MKNVSLLIIGAIIGALATYYFCPNCSGNGDMVGNIVKPAGVITAKEAMTLDQAFNSRHELISDQIVMRPDNRSAWWSVEDIKNYIKYAENQSHELGYRMDGLRLYLGAYPDSPKEGVGYTTMFFVPTGTQALSEGSSMPFHFKRKGGDIPGGDGLNMGGDGDPPSANYPQ
ncbi:MULTISPECIES: hypothetical protein [Bizionia]|uniref:Uncharacterized protein n=1 Tax=Bizionia algoritergicola TaxID=291187 RepID=A0A5D0QW47_9FLAO|nr:MULTISPECIES: hypothetical protein [Bizionia]OBX21748.1 hypothetical protein BAA08_11355 [Bizionia sp. APA-3]TYB73443.1 hypothetical protein ES675_07240 [Bizionia algoritergicola]